jgi:hypothetical protein
MMLLRGGVEDKVLSVYVGDSGFPKLQLPSHGRCLRVWKNQPGALWSVCCGPSVGLSKKSTPPEAMLSGLGGQTFYQFT